MMQLAIDRSAQTRGSFAASVAVHIAALVLLAIFVGREAVENWADDELTEIAYIEARYGEDVAEKVKLKALKPAGPIGTGITTDSAIGKPEPVLAPEPTPEPAAAPEPAVSKPEPAPAPPPRLEPQRAELAAVEVPVVAPDITAPQELAAAPRLEASAAPAPQVRVFDADKVSDSLAGKVADTDVSVPRAAKPVVASTFKPQSGGLKNRSGRAPVGTEPVVAAVGGTKRNRGAVAGADAGLAGGGLTRRGGVPAAPPSTRPALARGSLGGGGVVDVSGPRSPSGGGPKAGRKTILDYGSGGGGGGGGNGLVKRRSRLVEPAPSRDIVAGAGSESAAPREQVAEVVVQADKGVGMTITGQIAGRKIVSRVAPTYTKRARREGWEGVVAVHFTVLPDGRVKDNVFFEQTSVHRDLNQAARAAIRKFRFAPLPSSQAAVEQWGVITIVFKLS